ncbi:MAG: PilZ domain-containing protein [Desulfobacterales bacterium]|nr:PilZ domain-containing protein [Desulfobacterales bacterium]
MRLDVERRKQDRIPAREKTFAMLKSSERLGLVKNFSETGLLFEYIGQARLERNPLTAYFQKLVVFNVGDEFRIDSISCCIVHDDPVENSSSFITSVPIRRCGIRFRWANKNCRTALCGYLDKCQRLLDPPA